MTAATRNTESHKKMACERRGRFRFAKQMHQWASYAAIELVVQPGPYSIDTSVVSGTDPCIEERVRGIQLGVRYAFRRLSNHELKSVRIERLDTNPVDSSTRVVAFVTCFAV